jgi:isopentenyldiphosphate isomerase
MEPQDPDEPFDLYTRAGAPLGVQKPRREVHRDGDWHRSIHVWIWGLVEGAPHLVFQRRALGKDTWPGAFDVAVTGHVRAGELLDAALREVEEEIGIVARRADLLRLGLRRRSDTRRAGVIDNELQEIFARVAPVMITSLRPSPIELAGLVAVPLVEAGRALADGAEVDALALRDGALVPARFRGSELVPAPDGYYARAYASMVVLPSGGRPAPWEIG